MNQVMSDLASSADPLDRIIDKAILCESGCWEWTGWHSNSRSSYPQFKIKGRKLFVHRYVYEQFRGKIDEGEQLHHECENRRCFNPWHLTSLTPLVHHRRHLKGYCGTCGGTRIRFQTWRGRPHGTYCLDCKNAYQRRRRDQAH